MTDLQKWCQKILPVVTAAANGEEIEYWDLGKWRTKDVLWFDHEINYRVKPRTKVINGIEVPMHMTVKPVGGSLCWIVNLTDHDFAKGLHWLSNNPCYDMCFNRGLIYTNREDAIKCAKAMLGVNE